MTRIAIVHPTGLEAKELRDSLDQRLELWTELDLMSSVEEEIGTLSEARGAAKIVQPLDDDALAQAEVVFFCGPAELNRPHYTKLGDGATGVVLSPDARLEDGKPVIDGINLVDATRGELLLSPHPGTVALAHLLQPLEPFAPHRAVATMLQPASMRGKKALEEVLEQTRSLLAFEAAPARDVFPTQLAFNLLPLAGEGPRIEGQLKAAYPAGPAASVMLLQAGIFHSFSISLRIEFGEDPGAEEVRRALGAHLANDLAVDPELLGPVDAAAREEVLIGSVEAADDNAYWIWAVMDNLTRGSALNAIAILEAIGQPVTH